MNFLFYTSTDGCHAYNFVSFCPRYNTDWMADTEIDLNPNNSVIKMLRCRTVDVDS